MSKPKIEGSFVALIAQFNEDGSVDFGTFETLLQFQAENGTSAVLIMVQPVKSPRCHRKSVRQLFVLQLNSVRVT
ncbi:MAG: hypothetical protein ACR5LD_12105 [Symbiopectobacterium sp.]